LFDHTTTIEVRGGLQTAVQLQINLRLLPVAHMCMSLCTSTVVTGQLSSADPQAEAVCKSFQAGNAKAHANDLLQEFTTTTRE
jgi:hypothetical protein